MVRIKTVLDILAGLISLIGVAPLFVYLDRLPQIAFAVALVAAIFQERKGLRPLRGMLPTVVSIVLFLFYAVRISRENILDPAINILVILLAIRLLGERIPRNYLQVFALALFALSASSLYNLSPVFLLYLLALLLCIAASLVLLTFFTVDSRLALSRKGMKRLVTVAVAMPAAALPLILLFFVIMPRPQFPLWDFLAPAAEKQTGLSEKIEPGSSSLVREVKTAVLRAQSRKLPRQDLYWRGTVLNTPERNAWIRTKLDEGDYVRSDGAGLVEQTIFPELNAGKYLIILDSPVKISGIRSSQSSDLVFTRRSHTGRVRYDTVSSLNGTIRVSGGINRAFYLKLPDRISARVQALGEKIAARGKNDRERLDALEAYFSSARYRYTSRDLPRSGDPIDEFLFVGKAGHCEFFASSFLILLRTAGVPARLVGGYYGGEYNEMAGYYLVTEDMAHVWVEVYLEGVGWVRRDPSALAVDFAGAGEAGADDIIARMRKVSDSLSYYWNIAVITYDLDKQLRIFNSANNAMRNLSLPVGKWWLLTLMFALAALVAVFPVAAGRWGQSPEQRLLRSFYRKIAKKFPAVTRSAATGLMELAERIDQPAVQEFAEIFCGSVYRDRRPSAREMARLRELLKSIDNLS
ncbi:MAG: DUF3488 and transglutaminase-like domain-containing protein [Geobacteraceae bacterium]|nr:DUF3488 and transglutaminase-like domain-containing protein [Geobacteraceae bacterium]